VRVLLQHFDYIKNKKAITFYVTPIIEFRFFEICQNRVQYDTRPASGTLSAAIMYGAD